MNIYHLYTLFIKIIKTKNINSNSNKIQKMRHNLKIYKKNENLIKLKQIYNFNTHNIVIYTYTLIISLT